MHSPQTLHKNSGYIGRFAPSPTGPLHFGSLLAAIASYLDARANNGLWLVRMEDLDPPREPAGAGELILQQLRSLGLEWDGDVLHQSSRLEAYEQILQQLHKRNLCYNCDCSRSQVKAMGNVYNGSCRVRCLPTGQESAIRLKTEALDIAIDDLIQGHYGQNLAREVGDFVIRRKDGLFAYQLAVVIDDELQNISHIIRGFDLIDSTPRQIYLQGLLNFKQPRYGHIPIIVNQQGQKLSKQHFAPAIDTDNALSLIHRALRFLGQAPPEPGQFSDPQALLCWAIENWDIQAVPKLATITGDIPT